MFRLRIAVGLLVLGTPLGVAAQPQNLVPRSVMFPGSMSFTTGTIAPSEGGNLISSLTVEQGVTVWRRQSLFVVGFAGIGARRDTDGNPWNNVAPSTAGVKLVALTAGGVVQAVVGVTGDLDRANRIRASKAVSVSYWAGWRGGLSQPNGAGRGGYPGHVYASSGFLTAREPDNWNSSVSVEQGVVMWRGLTVEAVPYAGVRAGADTKRYAWNNRGHIESGLKLVRGVQGGVVEAGVAARREVNWITRASQTGTVAFVNVWLGWNPRYVTH